MYVSSTSVYGECADRIVTEDTVVAPIAEKSRARLAAEKAWLSASRCGGSQLRPVLLTRFAGVYGPSRSALHAILRRRTAPASGGSDHKVVSRVHVDDAVAALTASILQSFVSLPSVVNIADDRPASRDVVLAYAKNLLSCCARPSLDQADAELGTRQAEARSSSTRTADRTNKSVSNALMKQLLLPQLQYPTFEEGLTAIAKAEFGWHP